MFRDLEWGKWLYGLGAAAIGGGASAVSGGIVLNVQDAKDYNFGDPKIYKVMIWMFGISGLLSMFFYLKQHPLPEIITKTTIETTTRQQDPPAIVKTTIEETKIGEPPK